MGTHCLTSRHEGKLGLWDIDGNMEVLKLDWVVGRVGSVGSVLAENNTTSWLHLASWNLPDFQH